MKQLPRLPLKARNEIREKWKLGAQIPELAIEYERSKPVIYRIIKGEQQKVEAVAKQVKSAHVALNKHPKPVQKLILTRVQKLIKLDERKVNLSITVIRLLEKKLTSGKEVSIADLEKSVNILAKAGVFDKAKELADNAKTVEGVLLVDSYD